MQAVDKLLCFVYVGLRQVQVFSTQIRLLSNSLVPSPSFWVERKGEKEGLGNNPGWKCPESRNSATGVDYESWPQLQGAKPLRRKSRKPDQVDIARYSKEQIDAAIDAAVQAFGLV